MTIKNTISLQDKLTPVLRPMMKALNSTATAMASVDKVNASLFKKMQKDIAAADRALGDMNSELNQTSSAAGRGAASFSSWKNPLVSIAALIYSIKSAAEGIKGITDMADSVVLTNARLDLMNDKLQSTAQLQDMIRDSANRSRSAYTDTAAVVAKMGILAGDAFANTKEIVYFSELMNKSFKVGGASMEEQTSAMYQLTQAMAAGKLQGDEFRSIMENAPLLAQAIAKYTGKTKGELKEMSSDGVITSGIIKGAMFSAAEEINANFAKMPRTFSEATTLMKNDAVQAFQPVFQRLNQMINTKQFDEFRSRMKVIMRDAAQSILEFLDTMIKVFTWVQQNWPMIQSVIVGALSGIAIAYAAAKVAALLYAFAQGAVNLQLLLMNLRLLPVIGLVAAAVILWNNFGFAGKILAIILGILAAVIVVCTIAQYAFNAALWANPIVWVIALVVALIAIFIALIVWTIDLWQKNMDFKYGVIAIWNEILGFFDQVPIFFKRVSNGIITALEFGAVKGTEVMQGMANGIIKIINEVIAKLNNLPGVSIEAVGEVAVASVVKAGATANKTKRDADLTAMEAAAKAKAFEREQKAKQNKAADEAALQAKKDAANKKKQETGAGGGGGEPNWGALADAAGNPTLKGGSLDKVKKVDGEVKITDEDIKMLKDIAAVEFINKYTTLRPEMKVTFGDVRESADVSKIMGVIEDMVVEAYATSLVN